MKFLWILQTIQVALPGGVIWLWALFKAADRKSFYQKTIRIVSIDSSSKNQPQQNDIWEAIELLQQRDPRRLRRVIEHISLVFVRSKGVGGIYLRTGRVCVLNFTSLKSEPSARDRQIAIAGLLVHEATHGAIDKLQIPYFGSLVERIEKLCDDEEKRCVKRLAGDLQMSVLSPICVCFALKDEAVFFKQQARNLLSIKLILTGIGRANAEQAIRGFMQANPPRHVFTCGFAGGLNPALSIGDVVFETGNEELQKQLVGAGAKPARFFCAPLIATTVAEKEELRRTTRADAVEMESEIIHEICRERGIPCATVRVISDTAHEDLPLNFNKLSKPDQSLDFGKLAWAIAKSPRKIPALLRLQRNTKYAAQRLALVLEKVIAKT